MTDIAENFTAIKKRIHRAERAAGREEGSAQLVAVTKIQSRESINAAWAIGHRVFGENRVQEAQEHWADLKKKSNDLCLHLIGPLQTNKVKDAVALFDCIETVDREKLADALAAEMQKQGRDLRCFIQVNTGEEAQKAGIAPTDVSGFVKYCRALNLNIVGLMCVPPVEEPPALHFALLKKLARENNLTGLSMGMSGDFEKAIALGATHVRIGSALFGDRA